MINPYHKLRKSCIENRLCNKFFHEPKAFASILNDHVTCIAFTHKPTQLLLSCWRPNCIHLFQWASLHCAACSLQHLDLSNSLESISLDSEPFKAGSPSLGWKQWNRSVWVVQQSMWPVHVFIWSCYH